MYKLERNILDIQSKIQEPGLLGGSISNESISLLLYTLLSSFSGSLRLGTFSIHLISENTFTSLLGLGLVDVFNKSTLVLESVTLAQMVQFVVKVLVNLSGCSVLDQKTSENSESAHPQDLAWHSCISGTLPLTETGVSSLASRSSKVSGSGSRVHGNWLLDDKTVIDKLSDSLARVCIADFVHFIWIEPDLAFTYAHNGRGETLLSLQIHHFV